MIVLLIKWKDQFSNFRLKRTCIGGDDWRPAAKDKKQPTKGAQTKSEILAIQHRTRHGVSNEPNSKEAD
jgi:hypothetical protein